MVLSVVDVRELGVRRRWVALGALPAVAAALAWWAEPARLPPGTHPALAPDRVDGVLLVQVLTALLTSVVLLGRVVLALRAPARAPLRRRGVVGAWAVGAVSCAVVALALPARAVLPGAEGRWWWVAEVGLLVLALGAPVAGHLVLRHVRDAPSPARAVLDGAVALGALALLAAGPLASLGGQRGDGELGGRELARSLLVLAQPPLEVLGLVLLAAVLARVGLTAGSFVVGHALVLLLVAGVLRALAVLDPSAGLDLAGAVSLTLALGLLAAAGLQPLPSRLRPPPPWQGLVFGVLVPRALLLAVLLVVALRGSTADLARPPLLLVALVVAAAVLRHLVGLCDDARTHADLLRSRSALRELAVTDRLTGVADRRAFTAALDRALARAAPGEDDVVVAVVDVDGFRAVNDRCGLAAGDAVLVAVADRLRSAVRRDDLVARLGGDEFAVLVETGVGATTGEELATVLEHRLRMAFSVPVDVDPDAVHHLDARALARAVEGLEVSLGVLAAGELRSPDGAAVDGDVLVRAAGELVRRTRRTRAREGARRPLPAARTAFGWQEDWDDRGSVPHG